MYLILLLVTLGDLSPGGRAFGIQTADWSRMFERIGPVTFEPVVRITLPGVTFLIAPPNLLIAGALSVLIGLGTAVTWIAFGGPEGREVSPQSPGLATVLAAVACLAPGATIVFRIPVPASFVPIFQVLIPASVVLLMATLVVSLRRLDPVESTPGSASPSHEDSEPPSSGPSFVS